MRQKIANRLRQEAGTDVKTSHQDLPQTSFEHMYFDLLERQAREESKANQTIKQLRAEV
jgi:hypothetical protein